MTKLTEISDLIEAGRIKQIEAAVQEALDAGLPPLTILNDGMVTAMTRIGDRFIAGELFVPEMLISARAMKKGVAVLRPRLTAGETEARGRVVIGTVAGDQHDIGKNLVGLMLESAGFTLVDLGTDVSPDAFIAAVRDDAGVRVVALSALLTTTMPAMRETVRRLSELPNRSDFFVLVGGAPVTQAYADTIGADGYAPDAASAARLAVALTGRNG